MICMLNIRCSSLKFVKYIFLIGNIAQTPIGTGSRDLGTNEDNAPPPPVGYVAGGGADGEGNFAGGGAGESAWARGDGDPWRRGQGYVVLTSGSV
jgi:hypothetical protein